MRRETQNILLVLLGGALLKISFTGTFLRYVKPSHKWLLIAGGAIMVGLAVVSIARDLISNARQAEAAGHEGHRHSSTTAWLLLLPVLAVFLVAPPALGANSVQGSGSTNRASAAQEDGSALFPPLQAADVLALPLSDFASRAAWDRGNSLNNRPIKLTGFVVHDGAASYVARLVIACCAADAFPVKVKLDSPDVTALRDDTWVEVTVTVEPGTATRANDFVPSAIVGNVREISQPEDPYEH
jgi:uncharacterized repeat protein (TIGR03943 family)